MGGIVDIRKNGRKNKEETVEWGKEANRGGWGAENENSKVKEDENSTK